ncbi:MAG: hypothetical protein ACO1RA_08685 [Planctomycetaceae bacterium]
MEGIQRLIDATSDSASNNRLTLQDVKRWLAEYMEMRVDEVAHFPNETYANHWDLIAADYDSSKEAHFMIAYFAGDRVTFMSGCGSIPQVRAFGCDEFPSNADNVLDALSGRFATAGRWTTSAEEVIAWTQS